MNELSGWIAPAATMIAAMMTAANLGPRVTGWGFVVFAVGSVAWVLVALSSGQTNLLLTNGFLTVVNMVGIWRWLGRQARYADGGKAATAQSAAKPGPTLISMAAMPGAKVTGKAGVPLGVVVDAMMQCSAMKLAYLVVSDGGVAGVGERLHALSVDEVTINQDGVNAELTSEEFGCRTDLKPGAWPASLPGRAHPR